MYILGILRREPNGKSIGIILNCVFIVIFIIYLLLTNYFFMFTAKTFAEYSESSAFVLGSMLTLWWYIVYLWQREKYVRLIDDLDEIMEKRECNRSKSQINRKRVTY